MSELAQPTSLNVFQQYRQACSILRDTSRATNPAWYQQGLDLDYQIHIVTDGESILSFFYDRPKKSWEDGPTISEEIFTNGEQSKLFAEEVLHQAGSLKAAAVGVIIHVADEFATAELKPELDNPAALNDLREAAFGDPNEILADSSVPKDQASWRVLPYPAAGGDFIGTTITLSRRLEDFVRTLRDVANAKNFPIVPQVLSAPLVAIMCLRSVVNPTPETPYVAILQYPWFTAMAFFNEHSDLRLIRTLQHRGARKPSNLDHALGTTNASLEFENPDIFVIPLGELTDHSLVQGIQRSFPESKVVESNFSTNEKVPVWVPEPILATEEFSLPDETQESETISHTFGLLRSEKWFLQDFLPPSEEDIALFPSRNEIRMLRFFKLGRIALVGLAILGASWLCLGIYSVIKRPEWAFNESQAKAVEQRLVALTQERQRVEQWNRFLQDRSKAWASMEALARLFPADSGLMVKTFNHNVNPDSAPGQAQVGFVKEWTITGMARDEALSYLNKLNTREGIADHFTEIANATGNLAYDPTPTTRSLVVNVRTQENSSFRQRPEDEIYDNDDTTYPFTFNLTITQRYESADTMAIPAAAAP
ncbi:MAG: hypothetical protein AB8D78_09010 [Akkermansiaceae bacterium]